MATPSRSFKYIACTCMKGSHPCKSFFRKNYLRASHKPNRLPSFYLISRIEGVLFLAKIPSKYKISIHTKLLQEPSSPVWRPFSWSLGALLLFEIYGIYFLALQIYEYRNESWLCCKTREFFFKLVCTTRSLTLSFSHSAASGQMRLPKTGACQP